MLTCQRIVIQMQHLQLPQLPQLRGDAACHHNHHHQLMTTIVEVIK
jgi:hypothetical protein